jgi:hypothetical protein
MINLIRRVGFLQIRFLLTSGLAVKNKIIYRNKLPDLS